MIRIRSKEDGFRRCGAEHSADWVEYPDADWTPEQLEALKAEPMLQVEVVAEPIPANLEVEPAADVKEPKAKPAKGKAESPAEPAAPKD